MFNDQPTMTHDKGFNVRLVQENNLYYLPATIMTLGNNQQLQIQQTTAGMVAMIAPTTLTQAGPQQVLGGNNDYWGYNNQGYLVRYHRNKRKALFVPRDNCPVPLEQLADYRRTIIRRPDGKTEDFFEQYKTLGKNEPKRAVTGQAWTGESWFKVNRPPGQQLQQQQAQPSQPTATGSQQQVEVPPRQVEIQRETQQVIQQGSQAPPLFRHTTKMPAPTTTAIPHPLTMKSNNDYWLREGHMWKRVHVKTRREQYIPQQTDDGPDITKLTTMRLTIIRPTDTEQRGFTLNDDWKEIGNKDLGIQWTGSTNFEEQPAYNYDYESDNDDNGVTTAQKARAIKAPKQPTRQEREGHSLTHLPYRAWCDICVQSKGKANSHPRQKSAQPVIQVDFCYVKAFQDKQTMPVLTAVDAETGMAMAVLVQDKSKQLNYLTRCLQTFLYECGRAQATLSPTTLQTDQEDYLLGLLKATAQTTGPGISVRQAPAYSSQSQGSVERFHRTLLGQVRTLIRQVSINYNLTLSNQHPILPWIIRHAAYLLNRYAIHSDGQTSFQRRWQKDHKAPLCEMGETVQYMIPTLRTQPKLEQRFYKGIWLGRDTMTGESIIGIPGKIVKVRTIRRQIMPEKYDKQLLDTINVHPWTSPTPTQTLQPAMLLPANPSAGTYAMGTQTEQATTTEGTQTTTGATAPLALPMGQQHTETSSSATPAAMSPLATSPTTTTTRQALPMLTASDARAKATKRTTDEPTGEAETKQTRTEQSSTAATRSNEPATTKMRIQAVTITTKKGDSVTTASCQDKQEAEIEKMLQEPEILDNEGLDTDKMRQGMKKEVESMRKQNVFTEVNYNDIPQEHLGNIIDSRWVHKPKDNEVRSRIVAKGFTEVVQDLDTIYASTPIFGILRILLTIALCRQRVIKCGDISVAFLHALAAGANLYMWPPSGLYPSGYNTTTIEQGPPWIEKQSKTTARLLCRHITITTAPHTTHK